MYKLSKFIVFLGEILMINSIFTTLEDCITNANCTQTALCRCITTQCLETNFHGCVEAVCLEWNCSIEPENSRSSGTIIVVIIISVIVAIFCSFLTFLGICGHCSRYKKRPLSGDPYV